MSGAHFHFQQQDRGVGLLDIDQVGELLGLTREAIYARRHRDDFPPAIRIGNVLRWRMTEIDAWLDERDERREVQR